MHKYDIIIVGAGAAGLSAACAALARGRRVAVIDMGNAPARKVRISGGGRCNFTNTAAGYGRYFGENPDFVRGALARVTPNDILQWVTMHKIPIEQKAPGQYFTASGAAEIVNALVQDAAGADVFYNHPACDILHTADGFVVTTHDIKFAAQTVIIATGGMSYPNLGVSDFGLRVAKQFGHKIVPIRPALCSIRTDVFSGALAGISTMCEITIGRERIADSIMFTHRGLGGPAIYRATVRDLTHDMHINLVPGTDIMRIMRDAKHNAGCKSVATVLGKFMPTNLGRFFAPDGRNIADYRDSDLCEIARRVSDTIIPHNKIICAPISQAEVTRGGISTHDINQQTMESRIVPHMYFAGEVMDVTGDLGGFNIHWALVTGRIAGDAAAG
ncbi:MAG: aminoacetone oxidase family FAD-binding enzyme [Alphaproteobacteria bacterium]|nr:aminoacetone oxidase family FAD-binding enzyme [Alphaproteobacteria bacterium]